MEEFFKDETQKNSKNNTLSDPNDGKYDRLIDTMTKPGLIKPRERFMEFI